MVFDGKTQRIEPTPKRHQMTILWIRFIDGRTMSAFRKLVKYFKINMSKPIKVKIDFSFRGPISVSYPNSTLL